jgi:hypothetical protein
MNRMIPQDQLGLGAASGSQSVYCVSIFDICANSDSGFPL